MKSASLTMPVVKGLIKRVAGGNNPIADLFTEEQVLFLLSLATKKIDYSRVVVLGPTRAWKWKYRHPGLPWPITGELWQRHDGARLLKCQSRCLPPRPLGGKRRVHGLSRRGRRRARQRPASEDAVGTGLRGEPSVAASAPGG